MLCHVSEFHSFLSPDNIPLYVQLTLEHELGVPDSSPPAVPQSKICVYLKPALRIHGFSTLGQNTIFSPRFESRVGNLGYQEPTTYLLKRGLPISGPVWFEPVFFKGQLCTPRFIC